MLELKHLSKTFIVLAFCGLLVLSMQTCEASCTAVYVGQDVSTDGSIIFCQVKRLSGRLGKSHHSDSKGRE